MIADDPPARLDKALSRDVPDAAALSRTRLARLLADGAVAIDGVVQKNPRARVTAGARVSISLTEAEDSHIDPENIPLDILYEDSDLIVVNKPPGMVVHPAPGTPSGTLVNALLHHCGADLSGIGGVKRPGIAHRIDKNTSGLLVVAKTDAAYHGLAVQFRARSVDRSYLALCFGVPDANDPRLRGVRGISFESGNVMRITTQLARHKTDRQRQVALFQGGRHAVTRVLSVEQFGAPGVLTLVKCWLETGRTHQIRVHMAYAGHGLVGDPVYGRRRKPAARAMSPDAVAAVQSFPRQALHAAELGLQHPTRHEPMSFRVDPPADMANLLNQLRKVADQSIRGLAIPLPL